MKTIIICSGGEDGKDVRTAIRIEDDLFEKMFGSHIKDAMSFDEVGLYLETYVDRLRATCTSQDMDADSMSTRLRSLETKLEEVAGQRDYFKDEFYRRNREINDRIQDFETRLEAAAGQRDYFKDELDKCKNELDRREKEIEYLKGTAVKARPVDCFKEELDKRDREIESLKEAVVRANENADSYYKLYSSEREAHKKASTMTDDLNASILDVREIVAEKCDHWYRTIWDYINERNNTPINTLRDIANDIFDFGANNAQGLMEYYEEGEK